MHWVMSEVAPKVIEASGGSPFYSHNVRRLLLEAGFTRSKGYAVAAEHYGTLEDTRRFAALLSLLLETPAHIQLMNTLGLLTTDELPAVREKVLAWGERPDAFAAVLYCAALGWADETPHE